jgi:hypothetical protein
MRNSQIKPWPKVRGLKDYEWKRDLDVDIQDVSRHRLIPAVLARIEKDVEYFIDGDYAGTYDAVVFQEEDGIKEFTVSRRLVKKFKIGDHVILDVGGCCTILSPPKLVRERT